MGMSLKVEVFTHGSVHFVMMYVSQVFVDKIPVGPVGLTYILFFAFLACYEIDNISSAAFVVC